MGNPELPIHLVIDILSRLPVKTLLDFRRVCKGWLSLISDPYFANLHLDKSQPSLLLAPFKPVGSRESWKLNLVDLHVNPSSPSNDPVELVTTINLPKGPFPYNVVNSCNGLLCLFSPWNDSPISIYNPLLGELVTLPRCPSGCPILSFSDVAFGYSPMTDQYKVVRSFYGKGRLTCETEIYTLGEGSWRSMGKIPCLVRNTSFNAFLDGSLHWISDAFSVDFIYCLDFGSEQFRSVPEPSKFGLAKKECWDCIVVVVLQDCLSICDSSEPGHSEVWVMKDYGVKESWSKDFVIDTMMIDGTCLYYEPIMVLEDGQILVFEGEGYSILLYEPGSNCLRNVCTLGFSTRYFLGRAHVPSLLSLRNVAEGENFKVHLSNKHNCCYFELKSWATKPKHLFHLFAIFPPWQCCSMLLLLPSTLDCCVISFS